MPPFDWCTSRKTRNLVYQNISHRNLFCFLLNRFFGMMMSSLSPKCQFCTEVPVLINDNNNKLGATWNLSIYDCGCSKSIVDVLSVRDNGFSRSYWSFFIGVPFARKIAQVSRLSCKYFFIHRSKVRGLQVCSTLRPCHVLLDRWGSSDL